MSGREIVWRFLTMARHAVDVVRIPLGLYPKLQRSKYVSIDRGTRGFDLDSAARSANWKRNEDPFVGWTKSLCQKANMILEDRLTFFDIDSQFLGDPIDWQKDMSSGKSGPLRQSVFVNYREFETVGDCKLVWEPSRHHQLVVLARAYRVTGDLRYAEKVVNIILDWMAANPFGYGMNWRSPLEIGIRLINWTIAIDLIRDSGIISDESWATMLDSVFASTWSIQRQYSRGSSANNHLIGEAAGVFIATCYFDWLPNADTWRDESRKVLEEQINSQAFSDGCTREHAFGYQLFVIQFLTISMVAADLRQESFSAEFQDRLHAMYAFIANVSADTGKPPNVGDADNGYVLDLGDIPSDPAGLISVGARLFDDDRLSNSCPSETEYWLFGKTSLNGALQERWRESEAFVESGYFILRSNSSSGVSLFVDCAELGFGHIAAHGHADCLSFTLAVDGQDILVDAGTYDYFSFPSWRNYFRETRAHNTVTVDGVCQSESLGPFMWGRRAEARLLEWRDDTQECAVSGEHDGYRRLQDPVTHRRMITLCKANGSIEVVDSILASDSHDTCRYFHLAPDCSVEAIDSRTVRITRGKVSLELESSTGVVEVIDADEEAGPGWISPGYHVKKKSICLVIKDEIVGDTSLVTRIRAAADHSISNSS